MPFETIEILQDLFFVQRGYLNGNHFVYRSDFPILIDTGYISDFVETHTAIATLGVDIADVSLIVNTHTHCDHIGGNRKIQEKSRCEIAVHKVGKHFVDTRDDWSTWWRYFCQEAAFFRCTRGLEDGDIVFLGPHEFRVVHTPGHASDGIVLYNRREKLLISSDTLWERDMAAMVVRVEGSGALFHMLESLDKIESLDVERVYPGHGSPFLDFKKALLRSRRRIESYLRDPAFLGNDLIKKILVYTLLMRKQVKDTEFFPLLMDSRWYRETVDLYFEGRYKGKFEEVINDFLNRGIVELDNGFLSTTVKP